MLNEMVVRDRINHARDRAEKYRTTRAARAGSTRGSGLGAFRDTVGHGLIAIGGRLVGHPPMPDPSTLHRAA